MRSAGPHRFGARLKPAVTKGSGASIKASAAQDFHLIGFSSLRCLRTWNGHLGPATVYFPESRAEVLIPDHKMAIPCGRAIASKLDNLETPEIQAEMFIVVSYRPKWLLWYKSEKFPMKTEKTDHGTWIWKSIPR